MHRSFEEVLNSGANKSKSKETHAFAKSQRFHDGNTSPCFKASYDLSPLMMSSRIKRRDRTTSQSARDIKYETISPGPAAYMRPSFVSQKRSSKLGSTFDQAKRLDLSPREGVPGPGTYNLASMKKPQAGFSMGARLQHPLLRSSVGPGQYLTQKYNTVDGANSRIYSKYAKTKSFGMPKEERFHSPHRFITPAPNQYMNRTDRMSQSFAFGHEKREFIGLSKWATPGPGQYQQFSEFAERRRMLESNLTKIEKIVKGK